MYVYGGVHTRLEKTLQLDEWAPCEPELVPNLHTSSLFPRMIFFVLLRGNCKPIALSRSILFFSSLQLPSASVGVYFLFVSSFGIPLQQTHHWLWYLIFGNESANHSPPMPQTTLFLVQAFTCRACVPFI